jgi:hypothetical protein
MDLLFVRERVTQPAYQTVLDIASSSFVSAVGSASFEHHQPCPRSLADVDKVPAFRDPFLAVEPVSKPQSSCTSQQLGRASGTNPTELALSLALSLHLSCGKCYASPDSAKRIHLPVQRYSNACRRICISPTSLAKGISTVHGSSTLFLLSHHASRSCQFYPWRS